MSKVNSSKVIANIILSVFSVICILPFILLIISSFSSEKSIMLNGYSFIPKVWSLDAYNYLWQNASYILHAYGISIFITAFGTLISLVLTTMLAYPLSRKDYPFRKVLTFYVFFTMLFNGWLVPTYLLYNNFFHIKNTLLGLLIPYLLMNGFNVLLTRTFFMTSIPPALIESASIDGAGEFMIFYKIILPLSMPILATIGLFVGVAYWNDWFNGMVFLTDARLYSIQNVLNQMLQDIQFLQNNAEVGARMTQELPQTTVKMAIAVIGVIPMLLLYPFFQRYFVKGITVGAVKG